MKKYDIIIIGAGPAGIFAALELIQTKPDLKILMLEKGKKLEERTCPKHKTGYCTECQRCSITCGFSGAGAFSDGKLTLSPDIGGEISDYLGYEKTQQMIDYVDSIYLKYGAGEEVYGLGNRENIEAIRTRAIQSNLKLIEAPIRHLGTEKSRDLYTRMEHALLEKGVEITFNNPVKDLLVTDGKIRGVVADQEYHSDKVIASVGREGSEWLARICEKYDIPSRVGPVDIGVRVEVRNEIMKTINENLYEGKFVYYTPTFDDKVRTFCQNPGGLVSTEYYEGNLAVVNGHSYKDESLKTENTNFAILVSNYFTHPFKNPIEYGKSIAKLGNMLAGNRIIIQRYGDFKRGRRTTENRLGRNNIRPTLPDASPGDLSLVLPYRILQNIREMLEAMDHIVPGVASGETLLYGVEVKFYSHQVQVDKRFESGIRGLYMAGDGAGITRGLMQASVNGAWIGMLLAGEGE
jgi:uncharacterized FAD-dependent dehydrogenase